MKYSIQTCLIEYFKSSFCITNLSENNIFLPEGGGRSSFFLKVILLLPSFNFIFWGGMGVWTPVPPGSGLDIFPNPTYFDKIKLGANIRSPQRWPCGHPIFTPATIAWDFGMMLLLGLDLGFRLGLGLG